MTVGIDLGEEVPDWSGGPTVGQDGQRDEVKTRATTDWDRNSRPMVQASPHGDGPRVAVWGH
jgi:hypothetical protein